MDRRTVLVADVGGRLAMGALAALAGGLAAMDEPLMEISRSISTMPSAATADEVVKMLDFTTAYRGGRHRRRRTKKHFDPEARARKRQLRRAQRRTMRKT